MAHIVFSLLLTLFLLSLDIITLWFVTLISLIHFFKFVYLAKYTINFICSVLHIFNNIVGVKNIRAFLDLGPRLCCFFMTTFISLFTFLSLTPFYIISLPRLHIPHLSHAISFLGFSAPHLCFLALLFQSFLSVPVYFVSVEWLTLSKLLFLTFIHWVSY